MVKNTESEPVIIYYRSYWSSLKSLISVQHVLDFPCDNNKVPIDSYCKKQATTKTAMYKLIRICTMHARRVVLSIKLIIITTCVTLVYLL